MTEDASSLDKGQQLDLTEASLNILTSSPNCGKKFLEAYVWSGLSKVDPLHIMQVVLDDPH